MSRLLCRLGRAAALRPWRFIVAWLLVVGALAGVGGVAGGALRDDYTLAGTGSQRAADLLAERFPALSGADARVVVHAERGRSTRRGSKERGRSWQSSLMSAR